jgi:hypothetical protein
VDHKRRQVVTIGSALTLLSALPAAFAQQRPAPGPDAPASAHAPSGGPPLRGASGMTKPTSRAELLACLQAAADSQTVVVLDPATDVTVDRTIEVVQRISTSRLWGVIGNGAKIRSTISNGTPVLKYTVAVSDPRNGTNSRGLMIQTLDIIGSFKDGPCLMLHAPSGNGPIYRAILRDNSTSLSGGLGALHIKGAVFELLVAGHMSENNKQHGVAIEHERGAIVSNCMINALNSSRNGKSGLYTMSNSVDVVQGSFVNNGESGITAPTGLRSAAFINGENTGQFVFRIGGYATLQNCEASTDGKTVQRDSETGRPLGRPTEALVHYAGYNQYSNDLRLTGACKITPYNGGMGYLARIEQTSGASTVWLEPWMDKTSVKRTVASDTLPAIKQLQAT